MADYEQRVGVAERAARAGAAVAHERFRTDVAVETKDGKSDVVTQADRDAQDRVVEVVRETFPDDPVVGEETGTLDALPEAGPGWVVDPIDGTDLYVRGSRSWATSVAAVVDGQTVAAANVLPALGDVYLAEPEGVTLNGDDVSVSDRTDPETCAVVPTIWWDHDRREEYAAACRAVVERFGDLRRVGSAQAVLSMIASGQLEGALTNVRVNPWDAIAGVFMVRQAGGTVTDVRGVPWRPGCDGLVASSGSIHDEVFAAAREIEEYRG